MLLFVLFNWSGNWLFVNNCRFNVSLDGFSNSDWSLRRTTSSLSLFTFFRFGPVHNFTSLLIFFRFALLLFTFGFFRFFVLLSCICGNFNNRFSSCGNFDFFNS
jgi:hypothetical protein